MLKESTAQDRSIVQEEYRFNEDEHVHELLVKGKWIPLTGVSSVVKNITDFPIAAYYGARRTLMRLGYDPKDDKDNLKDFLHTVSTLGTDEEVKKLLKEAYTAHATYSKARAVKGTNSHDIIDKWIKKCIAENNGYPMESDEPKVKEFINLTKHMSPRFVASEKHGYNKDLWLGGIADVIVDTNIGLGIWDMKDRPEIYGKDILQMGGYSLLFPMEFTHVMGIPLEGKDPRIFYDVKQLQEVFKNQLGVYKFMQAVEPKK